MTITYPGVEIREIPSGVRTLAGVATSVTAFVGTATDGPLNTPVTINNFGDYERAFGGLALTSRMSYAVRDYYLNGGSRAVFVRDGDDDATAVEGDYEGSETGKTGIYALEDTDIFNMMCIPNMVDSGSTRSAAAAAYCLKKRAFLIMDSPAAWATKQDAIDGLAALRKNRNVALYFPHLRQPEPLDSNAVKDFAPCGAVAGIIARTDTNRGVWKAPAGLEATFNNVPELSVQISDEENGELNPLAINVLRIKPPAGRVVWGARTIVGFDNSTEGEWRYVPVRRLALNIEESLFRGTQFVVFEPNDEQLWSQIRLNLGAFMQDLFRRGAFQGTSPAQAYFVKCDAENNPQSDIDKGIVNILVGFAPLKPAEFVVISLQQIAGQLAT